MTDPTAPADPAPQEIMEIWVRRLVSEVAKEVADGIAERVGRIFLDAKTSSYEMSRNHRLRFEALEKAIADLRARVHPDG
jgi:hypothetical protein